MVPEIVAADMLHIETRRRRPLEVADRFCMRPLAAILVYGLASKRFREARGRAEVTTSLGASSKSGLVQR
jgi:hypothetical protein